MVARRMADEEVVECPRRTTVFMTKHKFRYLRG